MFSVLRAHNFLRIQIRLRRSSNMKRAPAPVDVFKDDILADFFPYLRSCLSLTHIRYITLQYSQ